jgi:hypothetical protein
MQPHSKKAFKSGVHNPRPNPEQAIAREPESTSESSITNLLNLLSTTSSFKTQPELKLTQEVIKSVSEGALGELLKFLGERLVGRIEVKKARREIQALVEGEGEGVRRHLKLEELEKVKRRRRAAGVAVDVARKKRQDARGRLGSLGEWFFFFIFYFVR